jgi:hypothetical protein
VQTYTIDYAGAAPKGVVIGTLDDGGARFVAMTDAEDPTIAQAMIAADPLGAKVTMSPNEQNRAVIRSFTPK